jgi:hypothetical protein
MRLILNNLARIRSLDGRQRIPALISFLLIITIPLASRRCASPPTRYGRSVKPTAGRFPIGNVIWILLFGIWLYWSSGERGGHKVITASRP